MTYLAQRSRDTKMEDEKLNLGPEVMVKILAIEWDWENSRNGLDVKTINIKNASPTAP